MQHLITSIFTAFLLSVYVSQVSADTVHKWVDVNGVTHYSDELPSNEINTVTQINLPVYSTSNSNVEDDYYSIANQWMRVHEQRLALEKIKLEKAKQKAALRPVEPQIIVVNETNRRGMVFPQKGFFGHPPFHGGHYKHKIHSKKHDRSIAYKNVSKREARYHKDNGLGGNKRTERKAFKTR